LLAQPDFRRVPWILETPDLERRVEDLTILHALSVDSLPTGLGLTAMHGGSSTQ
jgi:hypothetical protein